MCIVHAFLVTKERFSKFPGECLPLKNGKGTLHLEHIYIYIYTQEYINISYKYIFTIQVTEM